MQRSPLCRTGLFVHLLALLSACLSIAAGPARAEAFPTRDQNPLTAVYGQPLPVTGSLPAAGTLRYSLSLDISNSIHQEDLAAESIFTDYESRALTLSLAYGLAERWALRLEAPLLDRGEGQFDGFIDDWHSFWGLPRGIRPDYPEDRYRFTYSDAAGTQFDFTEPASGIGDIQLGAGHRLYGRDDATLSLWASVELPTGDRSRLTGNGSADYSLLLAASRRTARGEHSANIGVVFPGGSMVPGLETKTAVLFGHVQGGWRVHDMIELKLQLAGHGSYYSNTNLETLGAAAVLIFGGRIHTGACSGVDIGFSEDIRVGASPDISFLLSWSSAIGVCAG